jgi:hypothetical protein
MGEVIGHLGDLRTKVQHLDHHHKNAHASRFRQSGRQSHRDSESNRTDYLDFAESSSESVVIADCLHAINGCIVLAKDLRRRVSTETAINTTELHSTRVPEKLRVDELSRQLDLTSRELYSSQAKVSKLEEVLGDYYNQLSVSLAERTGDRAKFIAKLQESEERLSMIYTENADLRATVTELAAEKEAMRSQYDQRIGSLLMRLSEPQNLGGKVSGASGHLYMGQDRPREELMEENKKQASAMRALTDALYRKELELEQIKVVLFARDDNGTLSGRQHERAHHENQSAEDHEQSPLHDVGSSVSRDAPLRPNDLSATVHAPASAFSTPGSTLSHLQASKSTPITDRLRQELKPMPAPNTSPRAIIQQPPMSRRATADKQQSGESDNEIEVVNGFTSERAGSTSVAPLQARPSLVRTPTLTHEPEDMDVSADSVEKYDVADVPVVHHHGTSRTQTLPPRPAFHGDTGGQKADPVRKLSRRSASMPVMISALTATSPFEVDEDLRRHDHSLDGHRKGKEASPEQAKLNAGKEHPHRGTVAVSMLELDSSRTSTEVSTLDTGRSFGSEEEVCVLPVLN